MALGFFCLLGCSPGTEDSLPPPLWELEETARIGTANGEGTSLFTVSATVRADSTLYVLESLSPRVARFSISGEWWGDFAPIGDGPGEVRRPTEIGTTTAGIWVGDPAGARLEVYTRIGEPVESVRFDILPDSAGVAAFPLALLADGSVLAGHGRNFGLSPSLVSGRITHSNYYRVSKAGEILGVVYVSPFPKGDYWQAGISGDRWLAGRHPLPQEPLVKAFPDGSGIVVVEPWASDSSERAAFPVRVFRPDGSLETERSIPYEPVPVGDWFDRRAEYMRVRRGVDEEEISAYKEAVDARRFFPPVTDLRPGSDGSIWLRREETAADSVFWDVLDRQVRRIGRIAISKEHALTSATVDEVWARETDELDIERLVRYRVVR